MFNYVNNVVQRNFGASIFTFDGPGTLVASGNTLTNNTNPSSPPIILVAGASPVTATIENNTIRDNVCSAIRALLNDTNAAQLTVRNNTIMSNGTGSAGTGLGSAFVLLPNDSFSTNCRLDLENNLFESNASTALYCHTSSFNDFQLNAIGNRITDNGGGGFVLASSANTLTAAVAGNTIVGGGDHAITIQNAIAQAAVTITNNQLTDNTGEASGITFSHTGTDFTAIIANNTISDNAASGILMYSSPAKTNVTMSITNNIINNNQNVGAGNAAGGVDIEEYTHLFATIENNMMLGNVGAGLYIATTDADPSVSVCVQMSGNEADTGYTLINAVGDFNLAPCDVNAVNVGVITPTGVITAVQSCPDAVPCVP